MKAIESIYNDMLFRKRCGCQLNPLHLFPAELVALCHRVTIFFTIYLPLIRFSSFRRMFFQHLLELPVKEWGGGEEAEGDGQENARCLEVAGESEEISCWDVDYDVAHEGNPHH